MHEMTIKIDRKSHGGYEDLEVLVTSRMVFEDLKETFFSFLDELKLAGNNPTKVEPVPVSIQKDVAISIFESFDLNWCGLADSKIDDLLAELRYFVRNESVFRVMTNPKKYCPPTATPHEIKQMILFEICKDFEECKFYLMM
jgi:hypothetical protein